MLKPGDTAPDFSLPDHAGNKVTLDSLLDNGPLLLFFYPADFTPVCTREACMFRDGYESLAVAGLTVAGISTDTSETHARFRDEHRLPYTLLADPDKRVIAAYGVEGPLGIGTKRVTYLIDPDRTINKAVQAGLRLKPHEELMRAALAAATGS